MGKRGRPTKLNQETHDLIIKLVQEGNYLETASVMADVDVETVRRWKKRGQGFINDLDNEIINKIPKKEMIYVDFCRSIKKAMAISESNTLKRIDKAGNEDWKALAWRLERRFPERWAKKDRHEITGKDGGPLEVENSKVNLVEELLKIKGQDKK